MPRDNDAGYKPSQGQASSDRQDAEASVSEAKEEILSEMPDMSNLSLGGTGKKKQMRQGRIDGYKAHGIQIPNRISNGENIDVEM